MPNENRFLKKDDDKPEWPGGLVDAHGLLEQLFRPRSRPSLAWVRRQTRARAIPSVRIGRLVFYDLAAVREKLARKNTLNST